MAIVSINALSASDNILRLIHYQVNLTLGIPI